MIRKRTNKDGTVSWDIAVSLGKTPGTDKYKYKWETFHGTKREAEARKRELQRQVETGTYTDPGKMTVADFLKKWLETHKAKLAVSTYRCYDVAINMHIVPVIGKIQLNKLQPIHIQDLYDKDLAEGRKDNKKTTGKGLSPTTVNMHHRILHKALAQAVKWQLIHRNPAELVDPPKKVKKEIDILDEKEVATILKDLNGTYLYMPVYLAVYTGMRQGEILGLTWKDVDLNRGIIHVRQILYQRKPGEAIFKQPKTAGSRRTIDISANVVKVLKDYKKRQSKEQEEYGEGYAQNYLVCCLQDGKPINPSTISSVFRSRAEKLGIFITFHGLRHTHASIMLKAGVPAKVVSERLGHSQIGITMDIYSAVMPGMQKEAARKFEEVLLEGQAKKK